MKKILSMAAMAALLSGCMVSPHVTYYTPDLSGQVLDQETGKPLAGAQILPVITSRDKVRPAITDAEGRYALPAQTDWHMFTLLVGGCGYGWSEVHFMAPGYAPQVIAFNSMACGQNPEELRQPFVHDLQLVPIPAGHEGPPPCPEPVIKFHAHMSAGPEPRYPYECIGPGYDEIINLVGAGKNKQAIRLLEAYLEKYPPLYRSHFLLGSLYLEEGEAYRSISSLDKVPEPERDAEYWWLRLNSYLKISESSTPRLHEMGGAFDRVLATVSYLPQGADETLFKAAGILGDGRAGAICTTYGLHNDARCGKPE